MGSEFQTTESGSGLLKTSYMPSEQNADEEALKRRREKLFEKENETIGGLHTYLASEKSLAKLWNTKEEDEAWKHL
jgi:hypothetical protein